MKVLKASVIEFSTSRSKVFLGFTSTSSKITIFKIKFDAPLCVQFFSIETTRFIYSTIGIRVQTTKAFSMKETSNKGEVQTLSGSIMTSLLLHFMALLQKVT